MTQDRYTRTALNEAEDDLFLDSIAEASLFDDPPSHFDQRILVLDQGLYVIRQRTLPSARG